MITDNYILMFEKIMSILSYWMIVGRIVEEELQNNVFLKINSKLEEVCVNIYYSWFDH